MATTTKPIKLSNGDWLFPIVPGSSNTHTDHYHVDSQGVVKSIKERGQYVHQHHKLRKKLSDLLPGVIFPPGSYDNE